MKESSDQLRMMIDNIPALAWSCQPDGYTEFLNQLIVVPVENERRHIELLEVFVPIGDSAMLSSRLIKNSQMKV